MANFEITFFDTFVEDDFIKCNYKNQIDQEFNEHWIDIVIFSGGVYSSVSLNKSTAIKFAKTLRTEINKISENYSK